MKGIVHSSEVSDLVPISFTSFHDTSEKEHTHGFISKGSLWMCLVHDTSINIFSTETGRFCGSYNFGDTLKNPSAKITNVCEFSSSHIPFQSLLVSVKQDHESLLCMYNVDANYVVQAVLVPDKISSLEVVSGDGGVCMETHYLNRRLRYMFGIVALGTVNGHIYFLDLCLDESFSCDETEPNITFVLKQNEYSAQRREAAIAKKQHIFLRLNDESDRTGKFELHSRSSILGRYPNSEIYVSSIKYFRSLTTLAVGFSFGGIQLWELHNLTLQFTISTEPHTQPIVNFAFQEPENDPRNFCYLWVFRGHSAAENNPPSTISCASMYSMTFYKREYVKGFGALYIELQTCTKRFEFPFTNDIYHSSLINPSMYSRLLSCQVVSQKDLIHSVETVSGNESCEVSEDMSLCFITWEVWSHSVNVPSSYHFAVFDLNQWYQAQMPCSFRCDPSALSPYFGIFSLNEARQTLGRRELLGLYIIPQSIRKFKSLAVSEEFFYPSSLGFQIICFSHYGLCKTTYFGYQKHLLFEMAELGPKVLINPREVFSSLIKCGLVADSHSNGERTPLIHQKEAVLQLALEYHLPFFFTKCMKEWRYSDSVHEYCTSRALLNWAWKKVMTIKSTIDKLSLTLFNCSGVDVDKTALKSLYAFRRQLNLIDNIMAAYQKYVSPRTEQGIQDLQCRRDAVSSINLYLQVLLWLRSVHILPEVCESEATPENIVYLAEEISKSYMHRRTMLQSLNSSIGPTDVLLIDGIVKKANVSASWQEKGGSGMYPPPSIYAALGGYLLDGVSTEWKHAMTYYLLLDLRYSSKNTIFETEVKKFPIIFSMTKCMVKLVKAFWHLDRKECDYAIKKLLDSSVKSADILPWQHHRIIKSFLYHRAPQKALKYINHMLPPQNTIEDMRLYLSVLLACGATTQAFEYQRKKQIQGYGNDLLKHLFLGCQEMGKMRELMYLPLNSLESSALIQFLSESEDARSQEALVIYHLLHCNFFEAEKVNGKLSLSLMKQISNNSDALINERTVDRSVLVECLMSGISKTEKDLVDEINRLPPEISRKEESLKPLSISVKSSDMKKMTYSDFLTSLMYRAPLTISNLQTPLKSRSSSYLGELPFLRPVRTPESVKQPTVMKSSNLPVNKRSLLSTSPSEFSSPAKRSRLLDNATFKETPLSKRKTPKHLAGDIASLLQTPPIHRRISLVKIDDQKGTPTSKPQSILKKSQSTINPPQPDFAEAETPPLLSEDQSSDEEECMQVDEKNLEEDTDSEGQSKQIRFDIPIADQSLSALATTHIESGVADEGLDSSNNSILDVAEHSWKKSLPSLTREPLEGFLKQASQSDININVSENEDHLKSISFGSKFESLIFESNPLMSNTLVKTPLANQSKDALNSPLTDSKHNQTKGIICIQFSSPSQNSSLSQRTRASPRPPLRDEKINVSCDKQKFDESNVIEKMDSNEVKSTSQISHPDTKNVVQQTSISFQSADEENTLIAEDSDEEMFYTPSPNSSSEFSTNKSERLGEPIPFLDDSDLCDNSNLPSEMSESLKESDPIFREKLKQSKSKDSAPSRKTFVFTRCSTATTESSSKPTISNVNADIIESGIQSQSSQSLKSETSEDLKKSETISCEKLKQFENKDSAPSRKTFFFTRCSTASSETYSKSIANISTDIHKSDNLFQDNQSKLQTTETTDVLQEKETIYEDSKILHDKDSAPSRKTYYFTRSATVTTGTKTKSTVASMNAEVIVASSKVPDNQSKESRSTESYKTFIEPTNSADPAKKEINLTDNSVENKQSIIEQSSEISLDMPLPRKMSISTEESVKSTSDIVMGTHSENTTEENVAKSSNDHSIFTSNTVSDSGNSIFPTTTTQNALFSSVANTKPSRKTYIFTRSTTSCITTETDTSALLQKVENESSNVFGTTLKSHSTKPLGKTFIFTKPDSFDGSEIANKSEDCKYSTSTTNQTFSSQASLEDMNKSVGNKFVFSKPLSLTDDTNLEVLNTNLSKEFSQAEKPSQETFIFSKPLSLTDDKNMENENSNSALLCINQSSEGKVVKKKPSRKTYVFTRNSTANSTLNTSAKLSQKSTKSVVKSPFSLSSRKKSLSSKKIAKPSRKTYVFTRNPEPKNSSTTLPNEILSNLTDVKSQETNPVSAYNKDIEDMDIVPPKNENLSFLQDAQAETYEQFSSSLAKNTPFKNSNGREENKPFLSSPCTSPMDKSDLLTENIPAMETTKKSSPDESCIQSSKKKEDSIVKSKKKKSKAKIAKKIEFSFAEPHSPPADIVEALSQTPEQPLPTFLFSPPLTRGRLRQKRMDESLGSSFSSVISEVSFSTSMRPPMDPILEGIIQEKSLQTKKATKGATPKLTSKKKVTRKSRLQESSMNISDQSLLSLNESTSFLNSSKQAPSSPRHSMILRQTRSKRDTSLL